MPTPKAGYKLADGTKVPSVTTILWQKDCGGLVGWAWKNGYLQGQRGEPMDRWALVGEAQDVGTHAHALVEAHLKKLKQPPTPENFTVEMYDKAMSSFDSYLSWERRTRLKIISLEEPLVSEKYRYGGSPDALALLNDEPGLLDFKTSNSIRTSYLYQISAYDRVVAETKPDLKLTAGLNLLKFSKEFGDFAHHYFPELNDAFVGFMKQRDLYDIDAVLERRVK